MSIIQDILQNPIKNKSQMTQVTYIQVSERTRRPFSHSIVKCSQEFYNCFYCNSAYFCAIVTKKYLSKFVLKYKPATCRHL